MRLWRWARDVVADRGEHEPVPISLERAEHGYAFRLGVRAGFGGGEVARIPVRSRPNPAPHPVLKEIHECEVAGQRLEAANPFALRAKVGRLLEAIAPARALPLCYFRVPAMDYSLPVYEAGGRIVCPVLGGRDLRADDLAGIRRVVCQHLVATGYVASPEEVDVGVVRPRDLSLVPPAAVFRSLADGDLWLPSVEGVSAEGSVIGLIGTSPRLARGERRRAGPGPSASAAPSAPDVVALLHFVATELARGGGAELAAGAYASDVRRDIWELAEARTDDARTGLVAYLTDDDGGDRIELAVRRTGAGDAVTALEDRAINVFLAPDERALADLVGAYLAAKDYLRFATEVEIQPAAPPRAERLDADAIRTRGEGEPALAGTKEEVEAPWSSR